MYRYNELGIERLRKKDFLGAINAFKTALSYDPYNKSVRNNLAFAYNNYGFYLMKQGNLNLAIEKYEQAIQYDDTNPYIFYNLGQAYYKKQKLSLAKKYLRMAYKLDPKIKGLKELLSKIEKENPVESGFDKLETMHFIISFSSGVDIEKMSYIKTYCEDVYGRVGMFLDYYPKEKIVVVVYSEKQYQKLLNNKPHWAMAIYDGKIRIPADKFKYNRNDIVKIIYHEYAHVLVRDLAGADKCPLWLNEGIAAKMEDLVSPMDRELIRKYIGEAGLIPFWNIPNNFLSFGDAKFIRLLYIESYLLVDFIVKKVGGRGLKDILININKGMDIQLALPLVLKEPLKNFLYEWESYIRNKYGIVNLRYR